MRFADAVELARRIYKHTHYSDGSWEWDDTEVAELILEALRQPPESRLERDEISLLP